MESARRPDRAILIDADSTARAEYDTNGWRHTFASPPVHLAIVTSAPLTLMTIINQTPEPDVQSGVRK